MSIPYFHNFPKHKKALGAGTPWEPHNWAISAHCMQEYNLTLWALLWVVVHPESSWEPFELFFVFPRFLFVVRAGFLPLLAVIRLTIYYTHYTTYTTYTNYLFGATFVNSAITAFLPILRRFKRIYEHSEQFVKCILCMFRNCPHTVYSFERCRVPPFPKNPPEL